MLYEPWPWYFSGFLIALVMLFLILLGKSFGMSSNLKTFCSMCGAGKVSDFFRFNWKQDYWNLLVVVGAVLGGYFASHFMTNVDMPAISESTIVALEQLNFSSDNKYLPMELFSIERLSDFKTWIILIVGGLFIGFGTRYANGCTSGHAISGLSNFQLPSLVAVAGFFIGGLIMVHLLFPLIF